MNDLDWLTNKIQGKLNNCENLLNQGFPVNVGFPIPLTDDQILALRLRFTDYKTEIVLEETSTGKIKYLAFTRKNP